ncbi:ferritin-like domain-containing protein [Rhodospirillaceae bacterium SYSU D60014]|uniref:ferritin-like domain-containing protein n=1 Tax=Virgifigura deserti TaxID=2268457 RepID=UPI0013C42D56
MKHWTLEDIPWGRFDASRVDPEIVKVVKAASMVEANGGDYATYLCNVFHDDPQFQAAARDWAVEEVQHGAALARWAALADPDFDFDACFRRFTDGYKIVVDADRSIRGSRSGELVARCIVETGTSSYYTALMEATDEPVLKEICRNIAADELRHYKLFYVHLKRYLDLEKVGALRRLLVALTRITESEDDELAYAYYATNEPSASYDRKRYSRAYARRAYGFYRPQHVTRGVAMVLKAVGLKPHGRVNATLSRFVYRFLTSRSQRLARAGA